MNSRLDDAIYLAWKVHCNQVDKGNNPYILHPLRVMLAVEKQLRGEEIKDKESVLCSAVLHDVIEDTVNKKLAKSKIKFSCGDIVLKSVETMTRKENESWKSYIGRVKSYWAPRLIKIVDLEDNLDFTRLQAITEEDLSRKKMYEKALRELKETDRELEGRTAQ